MGRKLVFKNKDEDGDLIDYDADHIYLHLTGIDAEKVTELEIHEATPLATIVLPFRDVETLDMNGPGDYSNADMVMLSVAVRGLKHLSLSSMTEMTREACLHLSGALHPDRLETLRLHSCELTIPEVSIWIRAMARLRALRTFSCIEGTPLYHIPVPLLCQYITPHLTELVLIRCAIEDADLALLGRRFPALKSLTVAYGNLTRIDTDLFPALQVLHCNGNDDLDRITGANLARLTDIRAPGLSIIDDLSACRALESIHVEGGYERLGSLFDVMIESCRRLKEVRIWPESSNIVTEERIQSVSRHPCIEKMHIDNNTEFRFLVVEIVAARDRARRGVSLLMKHKETIPPEMYRMLYRMLIITS